MKQSLFFLFLSLTFFLNAQKYQAKIIRDQWGVPHIHGKTDADAAYGLAWAHCEDDFEHVQKALIGSRGRLAEVDGKEGAILSVGSFIMNADPIIEKYYDSDLSDEFKAVLNGSVAAINQYAEEHPDEILLKNIFPIHGKDIIKGYILAQGILSSAFFDIARVFTGNIKPIPDGPFTAGSNGFAFAPGRMDKNETVMISNTHQPVDGILSWYEAHVKSDEGWNMLGGTFSIGVSLFLGANENLAWTHTTNYPDFSDVYQLEMHPSKKNVYKFDGEWLELEKRKMKIKVKIGPIKIPFKKTFYWSKYGTTLKKDGNYYSVRFPARDGIKAAEQWWRMNKAKNLKEFKEVLDMQGLSCQNIIYGDKEGNIFYLSNGLFPYREGDFNYMEIMPGNTSENLWPARKHHPISDLPLLENPESGYVFNSNNPPFLATDDPYNLKKEDYDPTFGFREKPTNRALRFMELMKDKKGKISYDELKKMKYDLTYCTETYFTWNIENLDDIFSLDTKKYPDIKDALQIMNEWDGNTHHSNKKATIAAISIYHTLKYHADKILIDKPVIIPEDIYVDAIRKAKKFLMKNYGTMEIPLGTVQRHIKGEVSLPISGMPEILAPTFIEKHDKKTFRNTMGESYILFARYTEDGLELETCHPFGSSNRKDSPHYTDQMELFTNQKLKKMTLDFDKIKVEKEYTVGN